MGLVFEGIKQGCLLLALLILAFLFPCTSKQRCDTWFVLYKSTYGTFVRNVTYVRMFTFCHRYSLYIYYRILIQLHTNVGYDNISSKFDFQGPSLKVKVIVAIFRKKNFVIALVPIFINGFSYNCTQRLIIIILTCKAGLTFRVHRSRSRSLWPFLEKQNKTKKKKKKKKKQTNKHCYGSSAYIY